MVGAYRNGSLTDVVLDGSLAYALDAFGGLQVVDVSQPQHPILLGTQLISGVSQGLALYGAYVLAAAGGGGVHIIDVSQPRQPTTVAQLDLDGESVDVALWETYAYVASGTAGIAVIDISQPTTPRLIGYVQPNEDEPDTKVVRLVIGQGHLYASNTNSELLMLSLSAPQQPRLQQRLTNPYGTLWALARHGHLLYATTILKHLTIYDVSDPTQTRRLAEAASGARDLAIVPPHLLLATESYRGRGGGLRLFDVQALHAPNARDLGLAAARVPQARVQSLKVDAATEPVARVTLWPQAWTGPSGSMTYAVSNNAASPMADPALYGVKLTYELLQAKP